MISWHSSSSSKQCDSTQNVAHAHPIPLLGAAAVFPTTHIVLAQKDNIITMVLSPPSNNLKLPLSLTFPTDPHCYATVLCSATEKEGKALQRAERRGRWCSGASCLMSNAKLYPLPWSSNRGAYRWILHPQPPPRFLRKTCFVFLLCKMKWTCCRVGIPLKYGGPWFLEGENP